MAKQHTKLVFEVVFEDTMTADDIEDYKLDMLDAGNDEPLTVRLVSHDVGDAPALETDEDRNRHTDPRDDERCDDCLLDLNSCMCHDTAEDHEFDDDE